ncbi:MAG: triosephosphate isomerase, partial [Actinomycetia bacterium]|nr:triosephosphate isomerase [Actinomycetes bacterium]
MADRRPMIAGNWKMHMTTGDAVTFLEGVAAGINEDPGAEVVVCPPYTALSTVAADIEKKNLKIGLGAQNMHWEETGAFTGEISPLMLVDLGLEFVIVGHSERRQLFGETNETVNKKLKAALDHGLKPIFCVGETLGQREAGQTTEVITAQIKEGL